MPTVISPTSYDDVPYPSHPMRQTHPDHLGTIAVLLGLEPPPPDSCRVLELGCASGGNLIPLAVSLPESTFVGIDLSRQQVADAQRAVDALGLQNIDLRPLSILDLDSSLGQFDYIICHGVYSWVPPEVQQQILRIYQRHLAPNGVGYISYNTHPGWHLRGVVRHMMNYHVGRYPNDEPNERVTRARQLLDFLARAASGRDRSYSSLLQDQAELLRQHSDAYLFHEHLEEHNEPVWFLDFCQRLGEHDLRYLAESEFGMMLPGLAFPDDIGQELNRLAPSLLEKEQYMDFVRNRSFRQTLVCHDSCRPSYELTADRVKRLWVASPVLPSAETHDLSDESSVEFTGPDGLCLESSVPLVKAALKCLGEAWPESLPFEALVTQARDRFGNSDQANTEDPEPYRDTLAQALLTTFARTHGNLLRLSLVRPKLTATISARPLASPLVRYQAQQGMPITNLRHELVPITPFDRYLLPLLDGTRNQDELLACLFDLFLQGELRIGESEQPVTDPNRAAAILGEVLALQLPKLARSCLLGHERLK